MGKQEDARPGALCTRDHRLPWKPHRGGRSHHRCRHLPWRRALGRLDRYLRGVRAARRRQGPLHGQGRAEGRRERDGAHRPCHHRHGPHQPGGYRQQDDRARWPPNKTKLGANAILAVSLAVCKAGAAQKGVPLYKHIADLAGTSKSCLPVPWMNVINGGSHAGNRLAMQEFMIGPTGAKTFKEAVQIGCEVYHNLKAVIKKKYGQDACNVGDEGGFAPNIQANDEGLKLLIEAIEKAGHTGKVKIGMDVAASEFCKDGKYDLDFKNDASKPEDYLTGEQLLDMYKGFARDFPVVTIEDPYDQDDWESYTKMTADMTGMQVVGDDLLVTNPALITTGLEKKACNALLLKVNQIGSVSESIKAAKMSMDNGGVSCARTAPARP